MFLELNQEQMGVLRRALEARTRDMHLRLESEPGETASGAKRRSPRSFFGRLEALERRAGYRARGIGNGESQPETDET
ncbi:hypothetical protein MAE02_64140 [Microvirga aerophila]|uniref:Uncharacterized protein n=1 Tax=Microvirga aerophila TaxID=670291 RepID=A0A512C3C7_9HYPH|nr:hypothetical protein MAE02_64140 [Microvirga aerophila]